MLGDVEQGRPVPRNIAGNNRIARLLELDADHAGRVPTHLADLIFFEPDRLAESARQQNVEDAVGGDDLDKFIVIVELDGDEASLE